MSIFFPSNHFQDEEKKRIDPTIPNRFGLEVGHFTFLKKPMGRAKSLSP
jgi:hypothetical protein